MSAPTPDSRLAKLRLMWGSMMPLPLLFFAATFIAKRKAGDTTHVPLPVLAVLGVAVFAVSVVMPERAAKARLRRFPIPADANDEQRALAAYNAAAVWMQNGIGPAVAISVLGLLAAVWESAGLYAIPFFVASYVALALLFPTHEKVLALVGKRPT